MRLSWNEIRSRAANFARDWQGEGYEKGQTQLFYRDFFDVFGVPVRRVASFEAPVKQLGDKRGFIDLFWKGMLLVEQKSVGLDLVKAKKQALDYFPALKDSELPRYILLSDFQSFELYDLEEDDEISFELKDLPRHVEKLGFIIGVERKEFQDQDPVNIRAAELVGRLHDALEDSGYSGVDLERFLVRLVFCLFADDTGIFQPRDIFLDYIEQRTQEDGSDLGAVLSQLFQVLDTPEQKRQKSLDEDLAQFPYVNGELFSGAVRIPAFNSIMRQKLIDAGLFDWSDISPAIFGSLFQSVMEPKERRAQGAHYTTEKNIMKVIQPLFLDDLRTEFEKLKARKDNRRRVELYKFQEKLSKLTFLDPACGCGNFLIIAYRELRLLEIEVIKQIRMHKADDRTFEMDAAELSIIDVDQFYGIEIGEFPAKIAETALWMMDHIMNNRISLEFGQFYARIPLRKSPHILQGDALELDWSDLLEPRKCSFVVGNPPFIGAKYQSERQRQQVRSIAGLGGTGGTLDYVAAWFLKAATYIQDSDAGIGFVATNSITQGEQVAQLWPNLLDRHSLEIIFAHRTFAWGSDARGMAHVHVVIIGLGRSGGSLRSKRLFTYDDIKGEPHESNHRAITPYLFDGEKLGNCHLVVQEANSPLNGLPRLKTGLQPIDDGNYIFSAAEKAAFIKIEPNSAVLFRPFIGSREFLQGDDRFILYLENVAPNVLAAMPLVKDRIRAVKEFRNGSKRKSTQKLAATPTTFQINIVPQEPFLVVPEVSSERREYVPIGWLEPPAIPSNLVRIILGASKPLFGLLTSAMHMSWLRHIGGRLESRYRYSIGLVYNTFPIPAVPKNNLKVLEPLADAILYARKSHPNATLSDLYDPDLMPPALRKAHRALDMAVDKLYRPAPFISDRERAEYLFGLYEKMASPLAMTN